MVATTAQLSSSYTHISSNRHADKERYNKVRLKYAPGKLLSFSPLETAKNDDDPSENTAFVSYVILKKILK